ncbi:MAG: VWA domain-containing protein [Clostridiaceae bacterium]|nr:VWA domain-containing protein [Clostridiaceae bacterium]
MKKKLKTSKILSAFIAFTIILLSLPVGIITPLGQRNNVVKASGVGPFKNVMHSLSVTTEMDEDGFYTKCKRDIAGQVEFDWPEPSTYVDFIIIQDTSASFSGQIEEIKTALTGIVKSLNMGVDIDGVSPKDRVMGVSFHGSDGYAITNSSSPTPQTTFYSADNDHLILPTGLMTDQAEVIEAINELTLSGGTPTVDGLAVARENYNAAISTGEFYNNSTYQVEGHERQRRTVYMLITDGIANNTMEKSFLIKPPVERYGDYSNQPGFSPDLSFNWRDNAKMPRFMQAMWAKYTNESTVNEYAIYLPYRPDFSPSSWYKIYNPNIFPNKIGFYLVDQYGYENPTPAYPSFREDVDLQTANLVAYANLMKQEGFGTETNPTEFITAFWENGRVVR